MSVRPACDRPGVVSVLVGGDRVGAVGVGGSAAAAAVGSAGAGANRTSVKRVVSELEGKVNWNPNFASCGEANFRDSHLNTRPLYANNNKKDQRLVASFLDRSDETTSADNSRGRLLSSSTTKTMLDSDSSFQEKRKSRGITTTVSVSTCPSCGSENVSSSPSTSTTAATSSGARRSQSFQQVNSAAVATRPHYTRCEGCIRPPPAPIYRSHSFTSFKCPDYDSDVRREVMPDCDCTSCRIARHKRKVHNQCSGVFASSKIYAPRAPHRGRAREPLKKKKSKRNSAVSRSFAGIDSDRLVGGYHRRHHHCSSVWCTQNKYGSGAALAAAPVIRPFPSSCLKPFNNAWPSGKGFYKTDISHISRFPSSTEYRFWYGLSCLWFSFASHHFLLCVQGRRRLARADEARQDAREGEGDSDGCVGDR